MVTHSHWMDIPFLGIAHRTIPEFKQACDCGQPADSSACLHTSAALEPHLYPIPAANNKISAFRTLKASLQNTSCIWSTELQDIQQANQRFCVPVENQIPAGFLSYLLYHL